MPEISVYQTKISARRGIFAVLKMDSILQLMKRHELLGFQAESLSHEIQPGKLVT